MNRRHFLRASGVTIALPFLEAFAPARAFSANQIKRRMVAVNVGLGIHAENFFPKTAGRDFELSPYLKELAELREHFTVISGTSHPGVDGGHSAEKSFLTCAPHPGSQSFRNSISLDQLAAEKLGGETRFASLSLSLSGRSLSWSRSGVEIPSETRPSHVFAKLFLEGKPEEKKQQIQKLRDGQSIMDAVMDRTRSMERRISKRDKEKLDEYFSVVRATEQRLVKAEEWEYRTKPETTVKTPQDLTDKTDIIGKARLMYDMMFLALQSDSTRFLTFFKNGINAVPKINGVTQDYHNLSHHGRDEEKISELTVIETAQMKAFGGFLTKMQESKEGDVSLLDQTQVLFGSNLGNASSHNNENLPLILAGGGFQHGQHLAFDSAQNESSPKLYVSMLQRLGLKEESFGGTSGSLPGLELA